MSRNAELRHMAVQLYHVASERAHRATLYASRDAWADSVSRYRDYARCARFFHDNRPLTDDQLKRICSIIDEETK